MLMRVPLIVASCAIAGSISKWIVCKCADLNILPTIRAQSCFGTKSTFQEMAQVFFRLRHLVMDGGSPKQPVIVIQEPCLACFVHDNSVVGGVEETRSIWIGVKLSQSAW